MAEQITTYLKRLQFDPKLLLSPIAKYVANPRLVMLLLFTIVVVGVYSYINLPRTLNPEIKIPIVTVVTSLPGAGPNDVESLVTIPIEDAISSVEKVKTVTSSSENSVSVVSIEFQSGVDPDKAQSDTKSAVDTVALPTDAQTPKVNKLDFENQPVWQFSVTTQSDIASLNSFAKDLQQKLEDLKTIKQVSISGTDEQEVQIVLKPTAVSTYQINPAVLSGILKTELKSLPAGEINTQNSSFSLTIDPAVTSVENLRSMKINVNGTPLSLGDIATVSQAAKPGQNPSFFASKKESPRRSVNISVFRTSGVNFDTAVSDAQKVVNDTSNQYQNRFTIHNVENVSEDINTQTNDLLRDFSLTVLLVFIILFIFVGLRQASVALLSAPLTFLITFTIMYLSGISLSFLSQFSLLLSLGLLVDDTIVVISAMSAYYRSGKFTPLQTGLLVWKDFFIPIFTTTVTTVWAFVPLLLSTGIIGEFIKPIPIVVSTTLLGSFIVALLITLPLLIVLLKPNIPARVSILLRIVLFIAILVAFVNIVPKSNILLLQILALLLFLFVLVQIKDWLWLMVKKPFQRRKRNADSNFVDHGVFSFTRIDGFYKKTITRILASPSARRTTIIIVVIFSLFSYLLVPLGFVQNEFFPKADANLLFVSDELPSGSNLEQSKNETTNVLNTLRQIPESTFAMADVGQSISPTGGTSAGGNNTILFTIILPDPKYRHRTSSEIAQDLRQQFASYQKGKLSVIEESGGPPAGADLQIKLSGNDLQTLGNLATKIEDYLKKQPGVTNIDRSIKPGTSKIAFVPDQTKMAQAGIGEDQVGLWLRTYASGFNLDKIRLSGDKEDTDITMRFGNQTQTVSQLSTISIPTQTGSIPITSLGQFRLENNPTSISRENSKRTLSVTASVTQGYSVTQLNSKLESFANSLTLPSGYSWTTGGINEENQNSVNSILQAMILSFILIITTMVIQFSSFRKALIVMLVIPLSISGVFIIFALTHTPLSFPALIGVLALFGIVVKNSILLVDKINNNLKIGLGFRESIEDGAVSRLEAISLTSIATIAGLIPITLSNPLWRGLGGAIIAGLTFSGTIMLFFIPVVYYFLFRGEYEKKNLRTIKR